MMIEQTNTAHIIPFPSAVSGRPANAVAFQLPEHSGVISPSLFQYYVDLLRSLGADEHDNAQIGDMTMRHWSGGWRSGSDGLLEVLDRRSGIKRYYARWEPKNDWDWDGVEWFLSERLVTGALQWNVDKLIAGRFKQNFEKEAISETEHQLILIDPKHRLWGKNEKLVFVKYRQWVEGQGRSHSEVSENTKQYRSLEKEKE